jgi:subtilisin family serine protease
MRFQYPCFRSNTLESLLEIETSTSPTASGTVARRDFTGSPSGTDDFCDHGTHVAGIASANTNNGIGVAGVGYDTHLLNGKVLDDFGRGSVSTIAVGLYWAADNGAHVINMSLGGLGSCGAAE